MYTVYPAFKSRKTAWVAGLGRARDELAARLLEGLLDAAARDPRGLPGAGARAVAGRRIVEARLLVQEHWLRPAGRRVTRFQSSSSSPKGRFNPPVLRRMAAVVSARVLYYPQGSLEAW